MHASRRPSDDDVRRATEAARCVVETHRELAGFLRVGVELPAVDIFVGETLSKLGAKSCFLRYRVPRLPPFPSHACLSVNDCVVHGTAATLGRPLAEGDLLKVDVGVVKDGWIGDAAWSYAVGQPTDAVVKLMNAGKESLRRGIDALQPGNELIEWAKAVQQHVETECGFHLVRGLGGHGYGRKLHDSPWISNVVPAFPGEWPDARAIVTPGSFLAVEPMIAVSTPHTRSDDRAWPMYAADGSMTVHHEADVYISDDGPVNLTHGLFDLNDVVLR